MFMRVNSKCAHQVRPPLTRRREVGRRPAQSSGVLRVGSSSVTKQVSLRPRPFSESMASTRRVVGWTGVDVDTSPTHYTEVASDCLWWPAVGADE